MKAKTLATSALLGVLAVAFAPQAGQVKPEGGLLGIKLYDPAVEVVKRFGSPTDVEAVAIGRETGAGGGAPSGGPSQPGFAPPPGGGGGAGAAGAAFTVPPLSANLQIPQTGSGRERPAVAGAGPSPGGGGGGAGGGTTGTTQAEYVRWIYRRGPASSFNFVFNKHNKVVQIEAIGISNPQARTSQGITLGASLAEVIRKYREPDGYDVGTDYFMVRFLQRYKVAFRFTREHARAPYRVTSIIVSAGREHGSTSGPSGG
jgi:hypothetical protein